MFLSVDSVKEVLTCLPIFPSLFNLQNLFLLWKCFQTFAGALTLSSVLLYPKTLGGGAVFSGWVPFNSSILEQISPEGRKVI